MTDRTRTAAAVAEKTERAASRTSRWPLVRQGGSDTVITTKVKADLFKEPELSADGDSRGDRKRRGHAERLCRFKADAEKAVRHGTQCRRRYQVKSAIKVK